MNARNDFDPGRGESWSDSGSCDEIEFVSQQNTGRKAVFVLAGAALGLAAAAFVFLANLLVPSEHGTGFTPGLVGALVTFSLFGIAYGVWLLKSPVRAVLDSNGIRIDYLISTRCLAWNEIAELRRGKIGALAGLFAQSPRGREKSDDVLTLHDEKGKVLVELSSRLSDFPLLLAEIEERTSAALGRATYDRQAQISRAKSTQLRTARRTMIIGLLLMIMGLACGSFLFVEHRAEQALARDGVETEATIIRHYMWNVTPRLEYEWSELFPPAPGDIDGDGDVDTTDLLLLLAAWGPCPGCPEDINGDGAVNTADLLLLLGNWG